MFSFFTEPEKAEEQTEEQPAVAQGGEKYNSVGSASGHGEGMLRISAVISTKIEATIGRYTNMYKKYFFYKEVVVNTFY